MKCYYHPEEDAVAQCSLCGAFICSDCAIKIEDKIFCKHCLVSNAQSSTTNSLKDLQKKNTIVIVISILLFVAFSCIFFLSPPFPENFDALTKIIISTIIFLFFIMLSVLLAESCILSLFLWNKWNSWRATSNSIYIVNIWLLLILKIFKYALFLFMPMYICMLTMGIWPAYSLVRRQIKIKKIKMIL